MPTPGNTILERASDRTGGGGPEKDGGMAHLLDQHRSRALSKLLGQRLSLLFHAFEPEFDQMVPIEHLAKSGQKFRGSPGLPDVDSRLE